MQPRTFYQNLPASDLQELESIFAGLSPENLHCDGEVDAETAQRRYKDLQQKLESAARRMSVSLDSISESEVYDEVLSRRRRPKGLRP